MHLWFRIWLRPDSSIYTPVESKSVKVLLPAYLPGRAFCCATAIVAVAAISVSNTNAFFIVC